MHGRSVDTPRDYWTRLEIDGVFQYVSLSMAAGHLHGKLKEWGFDKIQELIPYEYVGGPEHGKKEGQGRIWDLRVDAGGREAQLEELQGRYDRYMAVRQEALSQEFDEKAPKHTLYTDLYGNGTVKAAGQHLRAHSP
ncbi:hypothetical protein [Nitrosococcus halophilus]|uniref:hypothetical protein n=1 Tax=Nitrosococcus halophilus TaxID=133539 RepID=UPI00193DA56B|nr:hypothetical protein [Nitrosococcus halophilus]